VDAASPLGVMAVAGTLVIIAGGFDLSAGSVFAVSAIIACKVSNDSSAVVGLLAGLGCGVGLGLVNGLLCTYGRINHFVGTLATSIVFAGMATVISSGNLLTVNDQNFAKFGSAKVLGAPSSIYIFVGFALICGFILNKTILGRKMFASGGNQEAARLSGISTETVQIATYVLSGLSAAIAGIIVMSRSLSVSDQVGTAQIFQVLAAILVGGVSLGGGRGAVWRPVVGVLILGLISNGFNLNGIDPLYQQIAAGLLILAAVFLDVSTRRLRS
jgi:ribose transport system permease protein